MKRKSTNNSTYDDLYQPLGYGSSLYKNEEDKNELLKMSELQRESILSERFRKLEEIKLQQRFCLQSKKPKYCEAAAAVVEPCAQLSPVILQMPLSSSLSFKDAAELCVNRRTLAKWVNCVYFERVAKGCLLKFMGTDKHYLVAVIIGFEKVADAYSIEESTKTKFKLIVKMGNKNITSLQITYVSSNPLLFNEYYEWKSYDGSDKLYTAEYIEQKKKDIESTKNYVVYMLI
jgi:hypothetical protein